MIDPLAEKYYSWSPYVYCGNNPIRRTDPTGMDWYTNNDNGDIIYLKGITEITKEIRDKYNLGDNSFEKLGNDNMFGDNVVWGIYEGKSFDVIKQDFYNFGDLSKNYMSLQGYQGVEEVTIEKSETTEYSTDRSKHSREEYSLKGNPTKSYIRKGIQLDSELKSTGTASIAYYPFSNVITTTHKATVPMGESNSYINKRNNENLLSSIRIKGARADWKSVLKAAVKVLTK